MRHEVKQVNVRRIDDAPIAIETMARTVLRALKKALVSYDPALVSPHGGGSLRIVPV